jgi:glycosyltransferase involved in cell wall biosynthesis
VLRDATFVVARSPKAAALAMVWGARGEVAVVPHDVEAVAARDEPGGLFTVAFVGRLVEEKGVEDLLAAVARIDDVRLVVAGAGPLADRVLAAGDRVELVGGVAPARVGEVYARAHVTCVPSRTTQRWEEQFGRVAVESAVRAVPVIASSSGALPWVLSTSGGGVLVPERDPAALAAAIGGLRDDRARARALGGAGRAGALASFTTDVVARSLASLLERVRVA